MGDWQDNLTATWYTLLGIAIVLGALVWVTVRLVRARKAPKETLGEWMDRNLPRCPCGAFATEPAPFLTWERTGLGAWLRTLHGAPPRYARSVDRMRPPAYCAQHARVADARIDHFVLSVRQRYAELNRAVAEKAAAFEQEGLDRLVRQSLTPAQKRAASIPPALDLVRRKAEGE